MSRQVRGGKESCFSDCKTCSPLSAISAYEVSFRSLPGMVRTITRVASDTDVNPLKRAAHTARATTLNSSSLEVITQNPAVMAQKWDRGNHRALQLDTVNRKPEEIYVDILSSDENQSTNAALAEVLTNNASAGNHVRFGFNRENEKPEEVYVANTSSVGIKVNNVSSLSINYGSRLTMSEVVEKPPEIYATNYSSLDMMNIGKKHNSNQDSNKTLEPKKVENLVNELDKLLVEPSYNKGVAIQNNKPKKYRRGLHKKVLNIPMKLKFNFNGENLAQNEQLTTQDKYVLQIELDGNRDSRIKIKRNQTPLGGVGMYSYKNYESSTDQNNDSMEVKNIEFKSKVDRSSSNDENPTVIQSNDLKSTSQICVICPSNLSNDYQHRNISDSMCTKKDESVQASGNRTQLDLKKDPDLAKLELWLELLNNSEFNTYSNHFMDTNNQIKNPETEMEYQRSFQQFLKELEENDSHSRTSKDHRDVITKKYLTNSFARKNVKVEERRYEVSRVNEIPLKPSVKRVEAVLSESVNHKEKIDENLSIASKERNYDKKAMLKLSQLNEHVTLRTPVKELPRQAASERSTSKRYQKIYTTPKPETKNSESIWSRINPFRNCFTGGRDKSCINHEQQKKAYCTNYHTVEYESSPCNYPEYNDTMPSNLSYYSNYDSNYYSDACTCCDLTDSYTSNYNGSDYPYDTLPFMQCAGGCHLCQPELNYTDTGTSTR